MRTAVVAFLLSMLCAAILTPIVRHFAHRYGVLDQALSARKIHGRPVPRLGGIAIILAFYAPLIGLLLFQSGVGFIFLADKNLAIGIFIGGILIGALGVFDDLRGADHKKKFAVQFVVAILMYFLGFRVTEIANPFGGSLELGWLALPFTLIWIVGVINAMNLIDGLDGLAGGVALVAVLTTFLVSVHNHQHLMMLFAAALGGAVFGFLFYNFNPASIFMGDTGSMFLGFVLATSSLKTGQKSSTAVAVVIPLITLGLPILDTVLAMGRRAIRGRPIFQADKEHIHHRLLSLGLSQRRTVLILYSFCALLSGVALALTYTETPWVAIVLLSLLSMILYALLRTLGFRFENTSEQRRRNRAMQQTLKRLSRELRAANDLGEVWKVARGAGTLFESECISLSLPAQPADTARSLTFSHGFDGHGTGLLRRRFHVQSARQATGFMELGWKDGRSEIDRDLENVIERFTDYVATEYERLNRRALAEGASSGIIVDAQLRGTRSAPTVVHSE